MEIKSKTIPNTQNRYQKSVGYKYTFQDRIEKSIKKNLGILE